MKWTSLGITFIILVFLTAGCGGKQQSSQDLSKVVYQWEKAKFDRNYKQEQKLIYKKGSYEVHKTSKKINSSLKDKDIQYEIYKDKENSRYYVLANFKNPNGENTVRDNVVLRKKGEEWKVDVPASLNLDRNEVSQKYKRVDCIHCK